MAGLDIPVSLPDALSFALKHLEEEIAIITEAPILLLVILALMFLAMRYGFRGFYERERALIATQKDDIRRLKEQIAELKKHQPVSSPTDDRVFFIEPLGQELLWREREGTEAFPFLPAPHVIPSSATILVRLQVNMTVIPGLFVEKIGLELNGQDLPEEEWEAKKISSRPLEYLHFVIPPSLPPGIHQAQLTAQFLREGSGMLTKKFSTFTVITARSYSQLKQLSS